MHVNATVRYDTSTSDQKMRITETSEQVSAEPIDTEDTMD